MVLDRSTPLNNATRRSPRQVKHTHQVAHGRQHLLTCCCPSATHADLSPARRTARNIHKATHIRPHIHQAPPTCCCPSGSLRPERTIHQPTRPCAPPMSPSSARRLPSAPLMYPLARK